MQTFELSLKSDDVEHKIFPKSHTNFNRVNSVNTVMNKWRIKLNAAHS